MVKLFKIEVFLKINLEKSLRRIEIIIARAGPEPKEASEANCRGNRAQVLLQRVAMWAKLRF